MSAIPSNHRLDELLCDISLGRHGRTVRDAIALIERLTRELVGARELLRRCVTHGYSRAEINAFLAGSPFETSGG